MRDRDLGDGGVLRSVPAELHHPVYSFRRPREHRLDIPVVQVAHSAIEPERLRRLVGPGAEIDALHPAFDLHRHSFCAVVGHHLNSRITASTLRLSPGLALILATVASRSAFSTFSIFMASTTQS